MNSRDRRKALRAKHKPEHRRAKETLYILKGWRAVRIYTTTDGACVYGMTDAKFVLHTHGGTVLTGRFPKNTEYIDWSEMPHKDFWIIADRERWTFQS